MARQLGLELGITLRHPQTDEEQETFQRIVGAIQATGAIRRLDIVTWASGVPMRQVF